MKEYYVSAMCMNGMGEFRAEEYIKAENEEDAIRQFVDWHSPTWGNITVMLKEDFLKQVEKQNKEYGI